MRQDKKFGKLILPYGVNPEDHERDTADAFLLLGLDVEFVTPVRTRGTKTADVIISGVL